MSASAQAPSPASSPAEGRTQRWAVVRRWVMLAATVVLLGGILVQGAFRATEDDLHEVLVDGSVSEVWMGVDTSPLGDRSSDRLRVEWQGRLLDHHTSVVLSGDTATTPRDTLVDQLRETRPDLVVHELGDAPTRPNSIFGDGWVFVPVWVTVLWRVLLLSTVARLVAGPQPHVFRKWGWFWVLCVPVVGLLDFWLCGDRPGRPEPVKGPGDRRFSGWMGLVAWIGLGAGVGLLLVLL